MADMRDDIERILISEQKLEQIVYSLGKQISKDYKNKNLLLVSILKGSTIFLADLLKRITTPCKIDFMAVSSYVGYTSTGVVRLSKDLKMSIENYDVLLVDDILDTGRTLNYICNMLKIRNPKSLKICVLFDKPECRKIDIQADYLGTKVPNEFVVGYGLDYNENYRNLPFIGILKSSIYKQI